MWFFFLILWSSHNIWTSSQFEDSHAHFHENGTEFRITFEISTPLKALELKKNMFTTILFFLVFVIIFLVKYECRGYFRWSNARSFFFHIKKYRYFIISIFSSNSFYTIKSILCTSPLSCPLMSTHVHSQATLGPLAGQFLSQFLSPPLSTPSISLSIPYQSYSLGPVHATFCVF